MNENETPVWQTERFKLEVFQLRLRPFGGQNEGTDGENKEAMSMLFSKFAWVGAR